MIEIEEEDLIDLIHFARRYCDGRSTPSPFTFNMIYERLRDVRPELLQRMDAFDITLKDEGFWWPHAQDGNYNPTTGSFNAMPPRIQREMKDLLVDDILRDASEAEKKRQILLRSK